MAPLKCCVGGCLSTSATHNLYCFPRKDYLRNLWMSFLVPTNPRLLGLTKYQLISRRVCQKHFDRIQVDGQGKRFGYSYPCLFTEQEIEHGVPLPAASEKQTVLIEHNYFKEEDSEDDAENTLVIGRAEPNFLSDHNYFRMHIDDDDKIDESSLFIARADDTSFRLHNFGLQVENKDAEPPMSHIIQQHHGEPSSNSGTQVSDKSDGLALEIDKPHSQSSREEEPPEKEPPEQEELIYSWQIDADNGSPVEEPLEEECIYSWQKYDAVVPCDADIEVDKAEKRRSPSVPRQNTTEAAHLHVQCNVCEKEISGFRYVCVQCPDYDLCSTCEARRAHSAHYVLRVPGPRPESELQQVLRAIRQALAASILQLDTEVPVEVKVEVEDPLVEAPGAPCQPAGPPEAPPEHCSTADELQTHRTDAQLRTDDESDTSSDSQDDELDYSCLYEDSDPDEITQSQIPMPTQDDRALITKHFRMARQQRRAEKRPHPCSEEPAAKTRVWDSPPSPEPFRQSPPRLVQRGPSPPGPLQSGLSPLGSSEPGLSPPGLEQPAQLLRVYNPLGVSIQLREAHVPLQLLQLPPSESNTYFIEDSQKDELDYSCLYYEESELPVDPEITQSQIPMPIQDDRALITKHIQMARQQRRAEKRPHPYSEEPAAKTRVWDSPPSPPALMQPGTEPEQLLRVFDLDPLGPSPSVPLQSRQSLLRPTSPGPIQPGLSPPEMETAQLLKVFDALGPSSSGPLQSRQSLLRPTSPGLIEPGLSPPEMETAQLLKVFDALGPSSSGPLQSRQSLLSPTSPGPLQPGLSPPETETEQLLRVFNPFGVPIQLREAYVPLQPLQLPPNASNTYFIEEWAFFR